MALPGELKGLKGTQCSCKRWMKLDVQHSNAGYYLGYFCDRCGPWSRETGYYRDRTEAKDALNKYQKGMIIPANIRDTEYRGGF